MPDQDHSPAFWTSVASTFKNNPDRRTVIHRTITLKAAKHHSD